MSAAAPIVLAANAPFALSTDVRQPASNPALVYLAGLHSRNSRVSMTSKLNVVARLLGWTDIYDCPWQELRADYVIGILTKLAEEGGRPRADGEPRGRQGTCINCYLSAIKGVAKAAWLSKRLPYETFLEISAVKGVRVSREMAGRSLSYRESGKLIRVLEETDIRTVRDRAMLLLMLGCGLRRGEIPDLRFEDYDREDGSLTLIGKGDKERTVYLPDEVAEALDAWIDGFRGKAPGRMFGRIRKNGELSLATALDPRSVGLILKTRLDEAGIDERTTPHDLRRTFATRLLDDKVDIVTIKNMMGHANIQTTTRYDRRDDETQKRAARNVRL